MQLVLLIDFRELILALFDEILKEVCLLKVVVNRFYFYSTLILLDLAIPIAGKLIVFMSLNFIFSSFFVHCT